MIFAAVGTTLIQNDNNPSRNNAVARTSQKQQQPQRGAVTPVLQKKKRELLIIIVGTQAMVQDGKHHILETWVKQLYDTGVQWNVVFFTGGCDRVRIMPIPDSRAQMVCMVTEDNAYPPQKKVLMMWDMVSKTFANLYRWVLKMDADTYLNVNVLKSYFEPGGLFSDSDKAMYMGSLGYGMDSEKLGLGGKPYCLGMGYFVSGKALLETQNKWDTCIDEVVSNHSDTEVGRCFFKWANIVCKPQGQIILQMYWSYDDTGFVSTQLNEKRQVILPFPPRPLRWHFAAALLHSIKSNDDYRRLHRQVLWGLRPLQPIVVDTLEQLTSVSTKRKTPKLTKEELRKSAYSKKLIKTCVNNPALQRARHGLTLKECDSVAFRPLTATEKIRRSEMKINKMIPTKALVLDLRLPCPSSEMKLEKLNLTTHIRDQLVDAGFKVYQRRSTPPKNCTPTYPWTALLRMFQSMLTKVSDTVFMIIEASDEVINPSEFSNKLKQLLKVSRCGLDIVDKESSGVLLLNSGFSLSNLQRLKIDTTENNFVQPNKNKAVLTTSTGPKCFNLPEGRTSGCLSGLYHRRSIEQITAWISENGAKYPNKSMCEVLLVLSDLGHIVRIAYPDMVRTASQVLEQRKRPGK